MLTDLHIHSTFSDGKLSIPQIIDFYGKRGFDIIAITDHLCEEETILGKASRYLDKTLSQETFPDYIKIIKEEAERAMNQYGMLVIAGVEFTKNSFSFNRSAHILGIGITKFINADGDIMDLINKIKDQGAMVIAAHPVSTRKMEHQTFQLWDAREELFDKFDAWEVASGPHFFDEVHESGLPLIASSDFHKPSQINSWKSLVKCEKNFASLYSAVKKQDLEFTFFQETSLSRLTIIKSHITSLVHPMEGHDLQLHE